MRLLKVYGKTVISLFGYKKNFKAMHKIFTISIFLELFEDSLCKSSLQCVFLIGQKVHTQLVKKEI